MFIRSTIQHQINRGIKNPENKNRVENIVLNFESKDPIPVPKIAEDWAKNLAATYPEKYDVADSADSFEGGQLTEDDFYTEEELNDLKDDLAIQLAQKLGAPKTIKTKAGAVRWILKNQEVTEPQTEE